MNRFVKHVIIIAFLAFLLVMGVVVFSYFNSADISAVYTRNNLSWDNADADEDGAVSLDFAIEKADISLKNDVEGNIEYNIYLYTENKTADVAELSVKDEKEINKANYPYSIKEFDVKCAYRGYLEGGKKKSFTVKAVNFENLKLLVVIADNNSYPKEEKVGPVVANLKFNAEVLLDGQYPRGKKYSFSLKDDEGKVVETVHNDDGYISFSNIAIKGLGEYTYYLSQNEGKDKQTNYDKSIYKIKVVVEEKNVARVSYEKDGIPKETLPRFSNYKEAKNSANTEYPGNEKKSNVQPNYLLISTGVIAFLLILFYIMMGRKKG